MTASQTRDFFSHASVRFAMELLDFGQAPFLSKALKDCHPFQIDQLPQAMKSSLSRGYGKLHEGPIAARIPRGARGV
jgi:hypothetical protein